MATYLRREGDVFLFRRRVPAHLQARIGQQELYRSLKTSMSRAARQRAAVLFLMSERLFAVATDDELSDEDIRAAARHWLSQDHWQEQLAISIHGRSPGDLKRGLADLPRHLVELGTDEENGVTSKWARRDEAAAALNSAGYDPQQQVAVNCRHRT